MRPRVFLLMASTPSTRRRGACSGGTFGAPCRRLDPGVDAPNVIATGAGLAIGGLAVCLAAPGEYVIASALVSATGAAAAFKAVFQAFSRATVSPLRASYAMLLISLVVTGGMAITISFGVLSNGEEQRPAPRSPDPERKVRPKRHHALGTYVQLGNSIVRRRHD